MSSKIKLGILGCGTVGSALLDLISSQAKKIEQETGFQLEIAKVGVRSLDRPKFKKLLTQDLEEIVQDESIDMIVELMGGLEPTKDLLVAALNNSKPVVTANKELLANCGLELFELAESKGVGIGFEASVAGAVPIVRTIKDFLLGESITHITGILNGTTNYILSAMSEKGIDYGQALAEAQELGYAESNPKKDVNGEDAAAKIAILANLAFAEKIDLSAIHCEGIEDIDARDISYAKQLGYILKFLAIANRAGDKDLAIRVHPALVSENHHLAKVSGSYNAIFVEGESIDSLMLYGKGAGGVPTAGAVLSDILNLLQNPNQFVAPKAHKQASILPMEELDSAYYLRVEVADESGVLASVTKIFDNHKISIEVMNQFVEKDVAVLVFVTHIAKEKDLNAAIQELAKLDVVKNVANSIRVIDI